MKSAKMKTAVFVLFLITAFSLTVALPYGLSAEEKSEEQESSASQETFPFFFDRFTFREFHNLQEEMNRVFDKVFDNLQDQWDEAGNGLYVDLDVVEKEKAIIVTCDIPGMSKDAINITVQNNILTISGERQSENIVKKKENKIIKSERSYGSFTRSISLPGNIVVDKIKSAYKDGVLTVTIPKGEEKKKDSIKIPVE